MCSFKRDCWYDLLGLFVSDFVARYAHRLTLDKLSVVSYDPLTHSRHNAGDRSVKVGHEISPVCLQTILLKETIL